MSTDVASYKQADFIVTPLELKNIQSAKSRDKIGSAFSRIWDSIADWFCDTNRAEAKRCLFDICADDVSIADKFKSFNTLKAIVGDGYADRFIMQHNKAEDSKQAPTSSTFIIDLSGTPCADAYSQIKFERPNYPLGMQEWLADNSEQNIEKFKNYASTLFVTEGTDKDKAAAFKMLSQMVSEKYQHNFQVQEDANGIQYNLSLDGIELNGYEPFSLNLTKWNVDLADFSAKLAEVFQTKEGQALDEVIRFNEKQVAADLTRSTYVFSNTIKHSRGECLEMKESDRINEYKARLSDLVGPTNNQMNAIMGVCHQGLFGDVLSLLQGKNEGEGIRTLSGNTGARTYNVYKENNEVYVQASLLLDINNYDNSISDKEDFKEIIAMYQESVRNGESIDKHAQSTQIDIKLRINDTEIPSVDVISTSCLFNMAPDQ